MGSCLKALERSILYIKTREPIFMRLAVILSIVEHCNLEAAPNIGLIK